MLDIGDRVKVRTSTGGCYHGKTGTIVEILNGNMTPFSSLPDRSLARFPYWYQVRFDSPADNDGQPVYTEIFLGRELDPL